MDSLAASIDTLNGKNIICLSFTYPYRSFNSCFELSGHARSSSLPGSAALVQQGVVRGRRPLLIHLPSGWAPSQPSCPAEFQLPRPDARRDLPDSSVRLALRPPCLRSGLFNP